MHNLRIYQNLSGPQNRYLFLSCQYEDAYFHISENSINLTGWHLIFSEIQQLRPISFYVLIKLRGRERQNNLKDAGVCVCAQSPPTLCDRMDCSPPGSSSCLGFTRQEYWSGLPCPPPGDLPDPGIEPVSLMSLALAGGFFTTGTTWEAQKMQVSLLIILLNEPLSSQEYEMKTYTLILFTLPSPPHLLDSKYLAETSVIPTFRDNVIVAINTFFKKQLFIWLCWVLVAACGTFSCNTRTLSCGMQELVPWPGIEPRAPAPGSGSLSHRSTREAPRVKNMPTNEGDIRDMYSVPGSGRSLGGGFGNPLQYSCLEKLRDRRVWQAVVHSVSQSRTRLKGLTYMHSLSSSLKPTIVKSRSSSQKSHALSLL